MYNVLSGNSIAVHLSASRTQPHPTPFPARDVMSRQTRRGQTLTVSQSHRPC